MNATTQRRDPYQAVTDLIIEHLERGTVPWQCPWNREVGRPTNFVSGRPYRGINALLLGICGMPSPFWMTFHQAKARGGYVREGEHGRFVVKYGSFIPKGAKDYAPNRSGPESDSDGKKPKRKGSYYLREYTVFNATQIEGIAFPSPPGASTASTEQRKAQADAIVEAMPQRPPIIERPNIVRALYSPKQDEVFMPAFSRFETAEAYHLTLFHELIHSTGHESRLARETLTNHDEFGGPVYSQEELVAEMGAAFLAMEAEIISDQHEQSAAYLQSWLSVLKTKEHRRWIVQAASMAAKAVDFILARKPEAVETAVAAA